MPVNVACYIRDAHAPHTWFSGGARQECPGRMAGLDPQVAEDIEQCDECEGNGVNCPRHRASTTDPGTLADCVTWLRDAGLGTNADLRIARIAAQHQELQARYDTVVSDRATVRTSLDRVKQRIRDMQQNPAPQPPRIQLAVLFNDHTTMYYPCTDGWRFDAPSRCIVVGRGVPRTHIPLDQVRSFEVLDVVPTVPVVHGG